MIDEKQLIKVIQEHKQFVVCGNPQIDFIYGQAHDHIIRLIEILAENTKQNGWISVKEQETPTENGTYLCHGYWIGSKRTQTETADYFDEWNIANNFVLTHWMPLPESPKGGECCDPY